jgi:hypothetical protein
MTPINSVTETPPNTDNVGGQSNVCRVRPCRIRINHNGIQRPETAVRENFGGVRINGMELKSAFDWKPLPKTIEVHEADEKRITETLKHVEEYWNETAPYGGPQFDAGRGMELLLYDTKRYSEALTRIAAKADEQKTLIEHRTAVGEEVTEADRQRWFAYLDVAHMARAALSYGAPSPPTENPG